MQWNFDQLLAVVRTMFAGGGLGGVSDEWVAEQTWLLLTVLEDLDPTGVLLDDEEPLPPTLWTFDNSAFLDKMGSFVPQPRPVLATLLTKAIDMAIAAKTLPAGDWWTPEDQR